MTKHVRSRIAALVPSTFLIDNELCRIGDAAGIDINLYRVASPPADSADASAVADALRFMGAPESLAAVAREARQTSPDAVIWACTSGSFIDGGTMGDRQARAMSGALGGIPATTTSAAMLDGLRRMKARTIGVITPYLPEIGERFVDFLRQSGFLITFVEHLGGGSDAEVGAFTPDDFVAALGSHTPNATDVIVVPCTAVNEAWVAPALKAASGKPLLFANRATVEQAVRMIEALG